MYPTNCRIVTSSPKKVTQKRTSAAVRNTEIPLRSTAEDSFRIINDKILRMNPSADAPKKWAGLLWIVQNAPLSNIGLNSYTTINARMQMAPAGAM